MATIRPADDRGPTGIEVRAARQATDALREEVAVLADRYVPRREFDRHRRNVRIAVAIATVAAVLLLVSLVAGVLAYNRLGDVVVTNDERIIANRQLVNDIQECITPTPANSTDVHECFERGQAGQADAINELKQAFADEVDRLLAGG